MPRKALVISESGIASTCGAAINTYVSDLRNEGWSVNQKTVALTDSVATVFGKITGNPDHVQLFGHVAVPQVFLNPDGHGGHFGDCDAPYTTATLSEWNPDVNGNLQNGFFSSSAIRYVSRIDMSGLQGYTAEPEAVTFNRVLARNHAFRTGAFSYAHRGVCNDRLGYLDPTLTPALISHMEGLVGAGNVDDVTGAYVDETFEESYAGRSWLVGALYSGGDPFPPLGHMYYMDTPANMASGRVPIGLLQFYCSNGWLFNGWPFARLALAGGGLGVLYTGSFDSSFVELWAPDYPTGPYPMGAVAQSRMGQGSVHCFTLQGDASLMAAQPATGTQNLSQLGIPSGESWGQPSIAQGTGTSAVFGLSNIASGESWGIPGIAFSSIANTLNLSVIASGESWGVPRLSNGPNSLILSLIPSGEAWGLNDTIVNSGDLFAPSAIPTAEAWGNPQIGSVTSGAPRARLPQGMQFRTPSPIRIGASAPQSAQAAPQNVLTVAAIASGESWGVPAISRPDTTNTLTLQSIASGESWGSLRIDTASGDNTLAPPGIGSGETWGQPGINNGAGGGGLPATVLPRRMAYFTPAPNKIGAFASLPNNTNNTLAPPGIGSGESWGTPIIGTGTTDTLTPPTIGSGESWGFVNIRDADELHPGPIPSGEDFPIPGITAPPFPVEFYATLAAVVDMRDLKADARTTAVSDTGESLAEVILAAVVSEDTLRAEVRVIELSNSNVGGPPTTPPVADNDLSVSLIPSGESWGTPLITFPISGLTLGPINC